MLLCYMAMFENIFDYTPFLLQKETDSFTKAPLGTIKIKIKKKAVRSNYIYTPCKLTSSVLYMFQIKQKLKQENI